MLYYSLIDQVTYRMLNIFKIAGTGVLQIFIMSSFFSGFSSHDLAQVLACSASIVCGFGLRMVMIASSDLEITKKMVVINAMATIFVAYFAWRMWEQSLYKTWPFHLLGLQVYLIVSSFMSVVIIRSLDKFSVQAIRIGAKKILGTFISDDRVEGGQE